MYRIQKSLQQEGTLQCISEVQRTKERNSLNVMNVANPSERNQNRVDIKELIQERNLMCV